MATALTAHPYRNPVIGWMNDLREHDASRTRASSTSAGTRRTTRCWSSSATSSRSEVFGARAETFRRHQARGRSRRASRRTSRRSAAAKRVTVKAPAELPYVLMAYRAPALRDPEKDWEPYALEMLAACSTATQRRGCRATLVRAERIATSAERELRRHWRAAPACSTSAATPVHGQDRRPSRSRRCGARCRRSSTEGVTRGRARARESAGHRRAGLPARFDDVPGARDRRARDRPASRTGRSTCSSQKLREVTPEQVQEVARKYFVDDALTVAYLDPQPLDGQAAGGAAGRECAMRS